MRTLMMGLMIAGLMSTVGIYAASFGGGTTVKTLGGSSSETVSAPTSSAVTIAWTFTGDQITGAEVTWTPSATGTYDIVVKAGSTTGTLSNISVASTAARTDSVTLAATEASAISTAKVIVAAK